MRIAILAPTAAPAFLAETSAAIGGAERQLAALGHALTERGHEVDLLVAGTSGIPVTTSSGTIWPIYRLGGVPLLKLIHPKGSSIVRFLREKRSDVVLQRGASELTGLSAWACGKLNIPFVFCLASDTDLKRGAEILPHPQDRLLYRWGLARADRIVAQTRDQASLLERAYKREAVVLPSFPHYSAPATTKEEPGSAILWGGNIRPIKRPEWLLELAHLRPDLDFIVFGGIAPGHAKYAEDIISRLIAQPNIEYLGPVAPGDLGSVFDRCKILLNTSEAEGFPNTFLEAWQRGLQVVATVDADGLLKERGLGKFTDSVSGISAHVSDILKSPEDISGKRILDAREFVDDNFNMERISERWDTLLKDMTS
ncbi:MAG: glycosyltransferase family 4 protein [bacterium]|nr:glycosyltransferase family 4 protein [bacterium]